MYAHTQNNPHAVCLSSFSLTPPKEGRLNYQIWVQGQKGQSTPSPWEQLLPEHTYSWLVHALRQTYLSNLVGKHMFLLTPPNPKCQ